MTQSYWVIRFYLPFDDPGESISFVGNFPSTGSRFLDDIKIFHGMFGLPSYLIWYVHKDLEGYSFDRFSIEIKLYSEGSARDCYYNEKFRILDVGHDEKSDRVKVYAVTEDWARLQTLLMDYDVGSLPYKKDRTPESLLIEVIEDNGIFDVIFHEHDDPKRQSIKFEYSKFTCDVDWTVYDFINYVASEGGFEWCVRHGMLFIGPELKAYEQMVGTKDLINKSVDNVTRSLFFTKITFPGSPLDVLYHYDLTEGEQVETLKCAWVKHWAGANGDMTKGCFVPVGLKMDKGLYWMTLEDKEEMALSFKFFDEKHFNQMRIGKIIEDTGNNPYVEKVSIEKKIKEWNKKTPRNIAINSESPLYSLPQVGRTAEYLDDGAGQLFPKPADVTKAPNSVILSPYDRIEQSVVGPFVFGNGSENFKIINKEAGDYRFTLPNGWTMFIKESGEFLIDITGIDSETLPGRDTTHMHIYGDVASGILTFNKDDKNFIEINEDITIESEGNLDTSSVNITLDASTKTTIQVGTNKITVESGQINIETTGTVNIGASASAVNIAGGALALAHANHTHVETMAHTHTVPIVGPVGVTPTTPAIGTDTVGPCTDNTIKTKAD